MLKTLSVVLLASLVVLPAPAQETETDGQEALADTLLDHIEGRWKMTGTLLGEPVEYTLSADWVLGHQFMLLNMQEVSDPPEYVAAIYIGFDPSRDQYVVHWLDQFGGKASSTLGFGTREEDTLRLRFDYPSRPFRDTFTFDRDSGGWHFNIESQGPDGSWSQFADYTVIRK